MVKTTKTFSIEIEIYEEAKRRGINLSQAAEMGIAQACNSALRDQGEKPETAVERAARALGAEDKKEFKESFLSALDEQIFYAKGWKNKIRNITGIKLTQEETIELYNILRV